MVTFRVDTTLGKVCHYCKKAIESVMYMENNKFSYHLECSPFNQVVDEVARLEGRHRLEDENHNEVPPPNKD